MTVVKCELLPASHCRGEPPRTPSSLPTCFSVSSEIRRWFCMPYRTYHGDANWERCILQILTNNTKISLSVAFSISTPFSLRLTNSRGILTPAPQHFHIIGLHLNSLPSKHDAPHPPFFFNWNFFFIQYIFQLCFSPWPAPPRSIPPPNPPNFMLCFSVFQIYILKKKKNFKPWKKKK